MKQKIAERWVAALRSGEYEQTDRALCVEDGGARSYCCLGVLCELAVAEGVVPAGTPHPESVLPSGADAIRYGVTDEWQRLPKEVAEWAGLRTREGLLTVSMGDTLSLTLMNDRGMSFKEIAKAIARHQEEL